MDSPARLALVLAAVAVTATAHAPIAAAEPTSEPAAPAAVHQRARPMRAGRLALTLAPRYGYVIFADSEPSGFGAAARLYYGITEAVGLLATASFTQHTVDETDNSDGGTLTIVTTNVGATYAIDALPFSPMIEAGVGLLRRSLGDSVILDLGIRVGLSARWWFLDWIGVGFSISYHGFLTSPTNIPVYVEMGPQLALRWPH